MKKRNLVRISEKSKILLSYLSYLKSIVMFILYSFIELEADK